ncbi:3-hydroxybutyryl-CoA dehydrogenase [Ochrobactrum soli]|uniref:3-hydroxybutyryl-CoA dehydrogenase n=1 Tax=Ochrobactrum soli TaxID=2448455 RepID=A0A849KMX5_9HYPH|nr:3-hydroxybutyryl-CoA dehydrogenase [[Ochrobactrum] soli]
MSGRSSANGRANKWEVTVTRVACVGTGLVGSAWAVAFARGGCDVSMFDAAGSDAYDRSRSLIAETLMLLEESGSIAESARSIMARISYHDRLDDAVDTVDHVQESAKEDRDVKRELFAHLEGLVQPHTILASSTSAIKGSEFLTIESAERALVAHPVNPPSLIPLVELCGTPATSAATIERTHAFMTSLGMAPVTLNKEIDGFLLNRLQYTLVAEALHLVGEGYCSASDIDRVVTEGLALRWATIGPFEVAHLNSPDGFRGFVSHLGPMMRKMGKEARTDYDWPDSLATQIHNELLQTIPEENFGLRQSWRNSNIIATRTMQNATAQNFQSLIDQKAKGNDNDQSGTESNNPV